MLYVADQRPRPHDEVNHVPIACVVPAPSFGAHQLDTAAARQAPDNLVLYLQDFLAFLVEALRPQVLVRRGVDQLDIDPHSARFDQNAAFQPIATPEPGPDLPDRHRTAFVGEGGGSRNDEAAG